MSEPLAQEDTAETSQPAWGNIFLHDDSEDPMAREEPESDSDCSSDDDDDSDYDPDAMDVDEESDEGAEEVRGTVPYHEHTERRRKRLSEDRQRNELAGNPVETIPTKVARVLYTLDVLGLDLPIFLDALSWGGDENYGSGTPSEARSIQYARSSLLHSKELPGILERWWKPPRSKKSKRSRPKGAKTSMEAFAVKCVDSVREREMKGVAELLRSPSGEDLKEETLTSINFDEMGEEIRARAPTVWTLLRGAAYSAKQEKRNKMKNPDKVVLMTIAMLAYTRNHRHGRMQKMFAVYLKFRGLSAKAFDTLHALGVTMSHKWTCNAVETMSKNAMTEVVNMIQQHPFFISHDNVNIPFRVFSQRLDNKGEFGNGTAATVYVKRNAKQLPKDENRNLQETRAEGLKKPLEILEIMEMDLESAGRIQDRMCDEVLQFLIGSPEFDLKTYVHGDSALLQRLPAVRPLPCGPENITLQYMLGTVDIPEASYADNDRLLIEWLRQLRKDAPDEKRRLALEQLIVWVGDQLTVDRIRGLFKARAEDLNSYDRMDWIVPAFGWLHLEMAVENSIHKQYLGTSSGRGLAHDFAVLERKGLSSVLTKGPFHHNLQEALYHIAEAHIRIDLCMVAGVSDLKELRKKSPEELVELARAVVEEHASTAAIDKISHGTSEDKQDEIKRQTIMFNRDVLQYIVLDHAIKHGDVGIMEDSLPQLLC